MVHFFRLLNITLCTMFIVPSLCVCVLGIFEVFASAVACLMVGFGFQRLSDKEKFSSIVETNVFCLLYFAILNNFGLVFCKIGAFEPTLEFKIVMANDRTGRF